MKTNEYCRFPNDNCGPGARIRLITIAALIFLTGCVVFETSVRSAIDDAVSAAVEQEVGALISGYTDVMMYQLAYTQTFYLGGYGFQADAFEEGHGATWRVESIDREEITSFTAERALLKRNDDGSMWWYLKFDADEADPVEYEALISRDLLAMEMYIRDPKTGDIRYHQFAYDEEEQLEAEEGDESLEELGYQTNYFHLEEWRQFREGRETLSLEAGTFETDHIVFRTQDIDDFHEDHQHYEYHWWISPDVPGELVQFEYRDIQEDGTFRGELIELRDDYEPRFFHLES